VSYDEFYKTDPKLEAEFQTPTIFDRDFNFHCSIFYRAPKIVKIIIYILYICKSVSTHLNLSNFNLWVCLYGYFVSELQNFHLYQKSASVLKLS
jgi:hypothetical protein